MTANATFGSRLTTSVTAVSPASDAACAVTDAVVPVVACAPEKNVTPIWFRTPGP